MKILQLCTCELFENLRNVLSEELSDTIRYHPIKLFVEGSHVEEVIDLLRNDLKFEMTVEDEDGIVRVEDPEAADIRISILLEKEYEFGEPKKSSDDIYDIYEHVKFSSIELSPEIERKILDDLRDTYAQRNQQYPDNPIAIPEKVIDLLTGDRYTPGFCLDVFESPSKVILVRDVFARYLKERGLLRAPKAALLFEKEKFLTMFYKNNIPRLNSTEWETVFVGLAEIPVDTEEEHSIPDSTPLVISEGWLGLRELAGELFRQKGLTERDIVICSHWLVPEEAGMTNVDLKKHLIESNLIDPSIRQPSFNDVIRRKISNRTSTITNTDLGRLGESFTHRLLSRAGLDCHVGPASSGVCDISDVESGDPKEASWALNVKLSLEDDVNRSFEVAPEHLVAQSWVLLIMPRKLTTRLYPITSETMTLNSRSVTGGGLCVILEGLGEKLQELSNSHTA